MLSTPLCAQIVDDSTKLVYGPTSTKYILVEDLKHNDTLYHVLDTSLYNLEKFETNLGSDIDYQDLGANGTALKPIYYQIPKIIGARTGFDAFTPYVKPAEDLKYFNTKSPYIMLNANFGGEDRSQVDFEFSRNINPQWNTGFDIKHISTNKQIGTSSIRENQVTSTGFDFYTFHKSKNRKYHAMFHIYKMSQVILETGGIDQGTEEDDYYGYEDADILLDDSQSWDTRTRVYFYHQYSLKPFFEVYNKVERSNTRNEYTDYPLDDESFSYYDDIFYNTDSTLDASSFKEWNIEAGLKGRIIDRVSYAAYIKRKDIKYRYVHYSPFDQISENYLGGEINLHISEKNLLKGSLEVLDAGNYYFQGSIIGSFLKGSYTSSLYAPSLMSRQYFGNHYEWRNDFNAVIANTINGSLFYDFGFLYLEPEVNISTIDEYVYFDFDKAPNQESGTILNNKYTLRANFLFGGKFHIENRLVWNNLTGEGADVMRMPDWNYYGKWYYQDIVFNDFMEFQLGFNLRWQTAYFANEYDPITQQFFLQDEFEMPSFYTVDAFFVMKANNLSVFAKWLYINQRRDEGYFATPWYPGQRRALDLGVRWMFFN